MRMARLPVDALAEELRKTDMLLEYAEKIGDEDEVSRLRAKMTILVGRIRSDDGRACGMMALSLAGNDHSLNF